MLIDFLEWLGQLRGFELILWCIALFFSFLFIIQTIISLFTGGDHSEAEADISDGGDFGTQFFTIKNMIAFFTMFGWAGLAAYKAGLGNALSIAIGLLAGFLMVVILFVLMRQTSKLKHDGSLKMHNAMNKIGETYLLVPGNRKGIGKIQIQVQGRLVQLDAMTDDTEDIPTGMPIKVVNVINNQLLLVTTQLVPVVA